MKKIILTVILAIIVLLAAVVGVFTVAEYKPAAVETVEITGTGSETLAPGDSISVITWNTGFAALDAELQNHSAFYRKHILAMDDSDNV